MDKRGQFTFYRSFWEAVQSLPKKDRLPVLEAIISYALDGDVPSSLSQSQNAFFLLVKPNLDASRKKAANGKQGGSKQKANGKQNASKKENEKEVEIENEEEIKNEIEKEYECNIYGGSSGAGARATENDIACIGLNPGEFSVVTKEQVAKVKELGTSLFQRYVPQNLCTPADCRMIFCRTAKGSIVDIDAIGLLEYAFEAAHKAGKAGNWNYIEAVLDRCSMQDIYTAAEARRSDEERENNV